MPGRMAGRAALITGGGGGIGAATGRLFAEEGAAVALVDTSRAAVDAAAGAIRSEVPGSRILSLVADLSQESEARRAVDEAVRGLGALHTLVNVAGVRVYTSLAEADAKDWQLILGVNVLATAYCVKAALPALRASGRGTIVNVSSVYGVMGRAGMGLSCRRQEPVLLGLGEVRDSDVEAVDHLGGEQTEVGEVPADNGLDDPSIEGPIVVDRDVPEADHPAQALC